MGILEEKSKYNFRGEPFEMPASYPDNFYPDLNEFRKIGDLDTPPHGS